MLAVKTLLLVKFSLVLFLRLFQSTFQGLLFTWNRYFAGEIKQLLCLKKSNNSWTLGNPYLNNSDGFHNGGI